MSSNTFNDLFEGVFGKRKGLFDTLGVDFQSETTTKTTKINRMGSDKPFVVDINGDRHSGKSHIVIAGNAVIIDGVKIPVSFDTPDHIVTVNVIEGEIGTLVAGGNVQANTVNGSASISGNASIDVVNGDLTCMGNLTNKVINGDVTCMGDASIQKVSGDISVMGDMTVKN